MNINAFSTGTDIPRSRGILIRAVMMVSSSHAGNCADRLSMAFTASASSGRTGGPGQNHNLGRTPLVPSSTFVVWLSVAGRCWRRTRRSRRRWSLRQQESGLHRWRGHCPSRRSLSFLPPLNYDFFRTVVLRWGRWHQCRERLPSGRWRRHCQSQRLQRSARLSFVGRWPGHAEETVLSGGWFSGRARLRILQDYDGLSNSSSSTSISPARKVIAIFPSWIILILISFLCANKSWCRVCIWFLCSLWMANVSLQYLHGRGVGSGLVLRPRYDGFLVKKDKTMWLACYQINRHTGSKDYLLLTL